MWSVIPCPRLVLSILLVAFLTVVIPGPVSADPYAEPDPPAIPPTTVEKTPPRLLPLDEGPATEWALHKTVDGHPDGREQQVMWLMNRARANPTVEGVWLATTDHSDVASGRSYWGVNTALLQTEFQGYAAKPPGAFDARIYQAAKAHSEWMIQTDQQAHGPPDNLLLQLHRIADHGFTYNGARGNIFARTQSGLNCHAALNIDWGWDGGDGSGMQPTRGHRQAIMAIDRDYSNVGIAILDAAVTQNVGPLVMTGNYCWAATWEEDHYNRFLVGTVWADLNGNGMYDPGEGKGGVTVMPDHGTYWAETSQSGGYAIPILAPGTYEVTFSGNGLPPVTKTAIVGTDSLLLDLELLEKGDINGNGSVDLTDATIAIQVISGLIPEGIHPDYAASGADVNGDGEIGWEELVYILQIVMKARL